MKFKTVQALAAVCFLAAPIVALAESDHITFELTPNPKFAGCLVKDPLYGPPSAKATILKGSLNDILVLQISNVKPGLNFDVFTVERSPFLADGSADPNFKGNFGMAWYQSDLQAGAKGNGQIIIRTILLNQIFGFDAGVGLGPVNTFHLGFWFNNPDDAAACGFPVASPTPFNGEHKAGPLAMISVPSAKTTLGPLCTDVEFTSNGAKCKP